ncbi:MAG TPA: hypothetical protein VH309_03140 [Elusimicrobiota bacterium]|jgi:hypothetical protein|nr:hypothetical protein [Elusimicrobiota bacterium]
MIAALAALALAAAAHAAPAVPSFEQPLIELRSSVLAAAARLDAQSQIQKVDRNVRLTDGQAWQGRGQLASLSAQAQSKPSDAMIQGQLSMLAQDLDVYAQNCGTVRQQAQALAATAVKDPALAADAKKLYEDSRVLDSDAGYLLLDARNDEASLGVAGYGGQAYQLERLAEAGADLTPDVRESAKTVLDKISGGR